jgi:hypothetical protein
VPVTVDCGAWVLEAEPEATATAGAGLPAARACGCLPCRNFDVARDLAYPPALLALLRRLGVQPACEAQVYWIGRLGPGLHLYGGWFHVVGRIAREGAPLEEVHLPAGRLEPLRFSFAFHDRPLEVRPSLAGQSVLQLEFTAEVPWVTDEPEPLG